MLCKNPWMAGNTPCPCGQCTPCRVNTRRLWGHRIMLEARASSSSCFLTCTYDDVHVPEDFSLSPRHHELFIKNLRKRLPVGSIRYLGVGEYGGYLYDGEGSRRVNPHYHYALFGFDCCGPIKYLQSGDRCWCSNCEMVRKVWGKGNIVIEPLNITTSNYISGYILKKMTKRGDERLEGRWPEFKRSSNGGGSAVVKGGIGAPAVFNIWNAFHDRHSGEIFDVNGDVPSSLQMEGRLYPLGRYLRRKLRVLSQGSPETPEEVLQTYQTELLSMFIDAGGFEKYLSVKDYLVKSNLGRVQLLEARLQLPKKGKKL